MAGQLTARPREQGQDVQGFTGKPFEVAYKRATRIRDVPWQHQSQEGGIGPRAKPPKGLGWRLGSANSAMRHEAHSTIEGSSVLRGRRIVSSMLAQNWP